jgi:hypothetical protein
VLEAIRAALPVCDELMVGDGGSSDGTWEALEALAVVEPRVDLVRDPWPPGRDFASTIRLASERQRRRCRGEWCFYLQANEILHEATTVELQSLPARFPTADMFRLPFLSLLGRRQAFHLEFRRRLVRNRPYIQVRGDGFDLGYAPLVLLLRSPARFLRYVAHRRGEMPVYLSRPVFRYRALCPQNYLRKTVARAEWLGASPTAAAWRREAAIAEDVAKGFSAPDHRPEDYWRALRTELAAEGLWPSASTGAPPADVDEQPAILAELPERWEYRLEDSLGAWRESPA